LLQKFGRSHLNLKESHVRNGETRYPITADTMDSIGEGDGEGGTCPLFEINSGKFEILRALNFVEDLFFS